jgi:hypothetical protein
LLVLSQAVAVMCAAVALNDYAYFFTSWSDLFGSTPAVTAHPAIDEPRPAHAARLALSFRHLGAPVDTLPLAASAPTGGPLRRGLPSGLTATDWSVRAEWSTRGAVAGFTVTGAHTALTTSGFVYLPPAYFTTAARSAHHLPMVEVFADYSEHPDDLVFSTPYPGYLLATLRAHRAEPMVLVLVRTDGPTAPANGCGDRRSGPDWQSYFATDLPSALDRTLRLSPPSYGAVGIGAGGYCAMRLALTAPQRFTAAASLLGCWAPAAAQDLSRRPAVPAPASRDDDLVTVLDHRPPPVSALVAPSLVHDGVCGGRSASEFLRQVRAPMAVDVVAGYRHARFRWVIWKSLLPRTFTWLSQRFAAGSGRAT